MPGYDSLLYYSVLGYLAYTAFVSNKRLKLFEASRYQVLKAPPQLFPSWEDRLARWESDLHSVGYRHLLYYHNHTYTSIGWPNFYSVFVSPDGHTAVEGFFILKPRGSIALGKVTEKNGELLSGLEFTTAFSDPGWVISNEDSSSFGAFSGPDNFHTRRWPHHLTIEQIVVWHEASIVMSPFTYSRRIMIQSPEDWQKMDREKHVVMTGGKKQSEWVEAEA